MITSMCKRPLSFDPKWRCERIDFSIYNNNCFSLLLLLLSWIFLRQMSRRISNIRKFVMWNNIICSNHYYARHNKNMSFPCKSEFTIPFYFCSSSSETEMILIIIGKFCFLFQNHCRNVHFYFNHSGIVLWKNRNRKLSTS